MKALSLAAFAAVALACGLSAATPAPSASPADDVQDFVFLAEARPLLVRVQVRIDGRPLTAAHDDFLKQLFAYLDINGDGVLNKDEAERVPPAEQLLLGVPGIAGLVRSGAPSLATLDTNKDGKVTADELAAYYRKNGLRPFMFQLKGADADALARLAYLGGPRPDPEVAAVRKAVFDLLDADKDGKLTADELAAAPAVLLARDENEDEILTAQELVPYTKPKASMMSAAMSMMSGPGKSGSAGNAIFVPLPTPGQAPADLTKRMVDRYGAIRSAEWAGLVRRAPDLHLVLRFGDKTSSGPPLEVKLTGEPPLPADRLHRQDGQTLLDLGKTRVELVRNGELRASGLVDSFVQPQILAQFDAADANGDGQLDRKEASRLFGNVFKAMDRDGDGKVTRKELLDYLKKSRELHQRMSEACVTLMLRDQSRGLFDLLDANRDGKLSVRELRQAPKLLAELDRDGKGYLRPEDLPSSYRMTLRRGPGEATGPGLELSLVERLLNPAAEEARPARGPAWFRKMDRNGDGDVSRKEFLFRDELFRKLDADGDGLISAEEAEKAGDLGGK